MGSPWDDATEAQEEAGVSPFPHRPVLPPSAAVVVDNGDGPDEPESLDSQIKRLADYIQFHVPGEPSRSEGAVDTAIRLLGELVSGVAADFEPLPVFGVSLNELANWMREHHTELASATIAKASEYGALDLQIMGASLAEVVPNLGEDAPPAAKLQAAIAFYLLGKVSRVLSALAEGKPAPTDSWKDAEVYSMMGLYVQEHGRWP